MSDGKDEAALKKLSDKPNSALPHFAMNVKKNVLFLGHDASRTWRALFCCWSCLNGFQTILPLSPPCF